MDVLDKASLEAAREKINTDLGTCDILINGAGGNNPRATTTKEYYFEGDIDKTDITTFFNLDPKGVEFVFNLNFLGTLVPTQVFARDLLNKEDASILFLHDAPINKMPYLSWAAINNFTQWL